MNKGSYRLFLKIDSDIEVKAGALGKCFFPAGKYVYTGSAMSSLSKRIERHLKKRKTMRWHIDYLLSNRNVTIYKIEIFPSDKKEECEKNNEVMKKMNGTALVKGFGSSDCNVCPSHLLKID